MTRKLPVAAMAACALVAPAHAGSDSVVVFNEIQFNPPGQTEDGEWIEFYNARGIKVDVSGWRIDGAGYTFPAGTIIDPGEYVVVAKTPAAGQLGPFTGNLSNSGERLTLYNQSERLMDTLDYGDGRGDSWPAAADGSGATLAKLDPHTASARPGQWAASEQIGGTPGAVNFPDAGAPPPTSTVPLLALADAWRFNESGADLGAGWASAAHPVGGDWAQGPGGLGSESGDTIPLGTTLSFPAFNSPYVVTYYFEREFTLSAAQLAGLETLKMRGGFDDGAVIYLNGTEALRVNMPAGAIDASTLAASGGEVDELAAEVPLSTAALVAGENRISVEVHQEAVGSSDIVFGLELDAEIAGAVAGEVPLRFSEVMAAGQLNFWVELTNAGSAPLELDGAVVSAAGDPLREHVLAAGQLAPGAVLLLDEETLGFRPADGEKLFLYDAGMTAVLDAVPVTGRLRGRSEGRGGAWLYPSAPTPGAANTFSFHDAIVISEIAYDPPGLPATPGVPATYDDQALVTMAGPWRYNDADEALPSGWAASAHPVGGNWKQGPGPIGRETGALDVPLATDLAATYASSTVTYYFEADFALGGADLVAIDSLEVEHQIDDGAIFYLNGAEVARFNMADGPVGAETLASPGVGNASPQTLSLPAAGLVAGANRFSVEVHQSSTGSSDMVFGAALTAKVLTAPGVDPQPYRGSDNQWVELANRGAAPVDLGGWAFDDGIAFDFPAGTVLNPGEHACVVNDPALFAAAFPGARVLGQYSGSLSRSGERLSLIDAEKNPADEVRYFGAGAWPPYANGGGATLELRDLDSDNARGGAWASSDESGGTAWRTYSYTATCAASRGPDGQWREFNMGLFGDGEIWIDDISVIENGSTQKLSDTGFDNASAWRFRGNHRHSEIIDDPDQPGNKVLRLVATGPTEHMHNQVETTLPSSAVNGREYQISFRARWVGGSNQIHTRLYFNRCANVNVIDRPADPGTPSAPNSTAVANAGPTFAGLTHSPAVPAVGEAATVAVEVADPDGVAALTLRYAVNGGAYQSVAMGPSGGGGRYAGSIPGQSAGTVVRFYVEAADALGASSAHPAIGDASGALVEWDDGAAGTTGIHNFRIVLPPDVVSFMHTSTEVMSNDRLPCTVIDREGRIYYGVGVRLKSSERGRNNLNRVGYNMRFPPDGLYDGVHESAALDRSEGQQPGQRELLFDMMIANSGGVLSRYYDLVRVLAPNSSLTGSATLQLGRYDELFLDAQFDNGSDGHLYEYELVYYPTTANAQGYKFPQPDGVTGVNVSNLGDDPESYRWHFLNKLQREADNFAPIIAYCQKMSQGGAAFEDGLDEVVHVDNWLRGMAYAVLTGAGDNAAAGSQHNGLYYADTQGRVMFLPHDMDFSFDTNRSIYANGECNRLTQDQRRRRIYLGHLHDIITTTYNNSYMSMWTSHFAALDPAQNWSTDLSYMTQRSNNVLSQINSGIAPVGFSITTPSPVTVAAANATISGDGWVNVREIRLAGGTEPLAVEWTDGNSWRVQVPAAPGANTVTLEAVDFSGAVIDTASIVIDNTTPTEPASLNNIAISEIHYHPTGPTQPELDAGFTDQDQFEWLELANISGVQVDLTGVRFGAGIDYDFVAGTLLAPGGRLVVARDRAAFLLRYPDAAGSLADGAFANDTGLSNGGERLTLLDATGAPIRDFSYDDKFPWPEAADGAGPSLTLIAPESDPDHTLASNWRASVAGGGSPGGSDAAAFAGDPDADADADGFDAWLEHALGGSDSTPGDLAIAIAPQPGGGFAVSHPRNLGADDVQIILELSVDLFTWEPGGVLTDEVVSGAGQSLMTWEVTPEPGVVRGFVRVRAAAR